jgi:hypothetical protein
VETSAQCGCFCRTKCGLTNQRQIDFVEFLWQVRVAIDVQPALSKSDFSHFLSAMGEIKGVFRKRI